MIIRKINCDGTATFYDTDIFLTDEFNYYDPIEDIDEEVTDDGKTEDEIQNNI